MAGLKELKEFQAERLKNLTEELSEIRNTEGKRDNDSKLHQKLDKDVNILPYHLLKNDFFTDGKINANGRFYLKVILFFVGFAYFLNDKDILVSLTLLGMLTILLPPLINIITKFLIPKMVKSEYNLYELLAGFGTYVIIIIPVMVLLIVLTSRISKIYPEAFESILSIPGTIILLAGLLFLIDIVLIIIKKH